MKPTLSNAWRSFGVLALAAVFASGGVLLAGKGGNGGGKPPKDNPPPPTLSFTMTRLGTLGGSISEAAAMNQWGDVLGMSYTSNDDDRAPFVYISDTNQMYDLRSFLSQADRDLWRWDLFQPQGINGSGQICGGALKHNESGQLRVYAVRITLPAQSSDYALVEIVEPDVAGWSRANGINEFGDVTGVYYTSNGVVRGFVYTNAQGTSDIGDLGGGEAVGTAINNLGEVAGYSYNSDGEPRAIIYTPGAGLRDLGIIKKVPNIYAFGSYSYAEAINDDGAVVGNSTAGTQNGIPVRHAFLDAGNGMIDLGVLGGDTDSAATSINAHGETVGWSEGRDYRWRGFFYSSATGMLELDSLIDNLLADTLEIIRGAELIINNSGSIGGSITYTDGTAEAFVLTPNSP